MVKIENLRHSYKDREVLRGISFAVEKGEIFGLLGPNGSGKTTLFRILSTVFPPTAGQVCVDGLDLSETARVREKIGVVFQSPSLDLRLTVWENLMHQGHLYGLWGAELKKRSDELLTRLGLEDRTGDLAGKLSGGLKRRVELAKGLLHRPVLLILDEPSTGLDPGARIDLWKYLKNLKNQAGVTVLVTTHLMEEAEHCDRIAILNQGKIVGLETPEALKREIGGDVLLVKAGNPELLDQKIKTKFQIPTLLIEGLIQIEHESGARFVTELVESFPGEIESVTFRKPTLEDVFIHRTGHKFWEEGVLLTLH